MRNHRPTPQLQLLSTPRPRPAPLRLLSARETDAVVNVAGFHQLTRCQLEEFLFAGSAVRPGSRPVLTLRVLGQLRRAGLVASTPRLLGGPSGGATRVVYALTHTGATVARVLLPDLPSSHPLTRATVLTNHCLMTADVALAFRRAARGHAGHVLVEWAHDWQSARRLGSSTVVPDAQLVYATPEWELTAFVEVDMGSEGLRFFAGKIERYLDLYRAGTWRSELTTWPLVLTVVPTAARASALRQTTEKLLARQSDAARISHATTFAFGSLDDLRGDVGPLGPMWQFAGRSGPGQLLIPASEPPD